jgi:hypothetical protein
MHNTSYALTSKLYATCATGFKGQIPITKTFFLNDIPIPGEMSRTNFWRYESQLNNQNK